MMLSSIVNWSPGSTAGERSQNHRAAEHLNKRRMTGGADGGFGFIAVLAKQSDLAEDQVGPLTAGQNSPMANMIFKCPRTGMNVQHRLDDEPPSEERRCIYEAVSCPACARLHFINRSTGRLLGDN
jgi:hypothetical protein